MRLIGQSPERRVQSKSGAQEIGNPRARAGKGETFARFAQARFRDRKEEGNLIPVEVGVHRAADEWVQPDDAAGGADRTEGEVGVRAPGPRWFRTPRSGHDRVEGSGRAFIPRARRLGANLTREERSEEAPGNLLEGRRTWSRCRLGSRSDNGASAEPHLRAKAEVLGAEQRVAEIAGARLQVGMESFSREAGASPASIRARRALAAARASKLGHALHLPDGRGAWSSRSHGWGPGGRLEGLSFGWGEGETEDSFGVWVCGCVGVWVSDHAERDSEE